MCEAGQTDGGWSGVCNFRLFYCICFDRAHNTYLSNLCNHSVERFFGRSNGYACFDQRTFWHSSQANQVDPMHFMPGCACVLPGLRRPGMSVGACRRQSVAFALDFPHIVSKATLATENPRFTGVRQERGKTKCQSAGLGLWRVSCCAETRECLELLPSLRVPLSFPSFCQAGEAQSRLLLAAFQPSSAIFLGPAIGSDGWEARDACQVIGCRRSGLAAPDGRGQTFQLMPQGIDTNGSTKCACLTYFVSQKANRKPVGLLSESA